MRTRKRRKVLVVDDDADILRLVAIALLQDDDWDVVGAASAEEALQLAIRERPHLVLLDWMMPNLDGQGALAMLRARPETAAIPVVVMTALGLPERSGVGRAADIADVIPKPFDPISLSSTIRQILDRRGTEYDGHAIDPKAARYGATDTRR